MHQYQRRVSAEQSVANQSVLLELTPITPRIETIRRAVPSTKTSAFGPLSSYIKHYLATAAFGDRTRRTAWLLSIPRPAGGIT